MGFLSNLFSSTQQQQQSNNGSQTGQSNTQGNIWNDVAPFLQQYQNQYSAGNIASTGTANPYQSLAGANQSGLASGSQLQPGVAASSNIATSGLTPDQIQQYMSPYIQSVVNPTLAAQDIQNKQGLSDLRGSQAARGALGNNTGSEAAYLAGVQPAQQAQIASLYNQGYNTAANTAATSSGLQLQGAGQLGNLTNVGSNANNTLNTIGQGIYNTSLTPYQLSNQGATGLSGLSGIAGSNTNSSGTATGTSNGTTTSSPSLGSILAGLAGTAISGYTGGLFGGGSTTDPGTAANGGWSTTTTPSNSSWWPFASGGSVHGDNDDSKSKVLPFHEKVATSFRALHALKKEAGGSVGGYDDGGAVGGWATTVEPSERRMAVNNFTGTDAAPVPQRNAVGVMPGQARHGMNALSDTLKTIYSLPRFDDGGSVSPFSGVTDALPSMDTVKSYLPSYDTGVWKGDAPTANQRFGAALAQVGNGPFAPFGKAVMDQQEMRYQDLAAQRASQELGMRGQELKMKQGLYPSELSSAQSDALIKAHEADLNWQLNKMRAAGATEADIAVMKAQKMYEFAKTLSPQQAATTSNLIGGQQSSPYSEYPDAKQGNDGHWYTGGPGNYQRVDP